LKIEIGDSYESVTTNYHYLPHIFHRCYIYMVLMPYFRPQNFLYCMAQLGQERRKD